MGKIVLYFQISLDGVISVSEDWANIDDELLRDSSARLDELEAVIFGSDSFEGMAAYWTDAEKSSANPLERELAAKLNRKKKYVASRSDVEFSWENTEHLKFADIASLRAALDELRRATDRDITVESGTGLWRVFLDNELYDEICTQIHPVIAGKGEKLYDGHEPNTKLAVKEVKAFESGVVKLVYGKR